MSVQSYLIAFVIILFSATTAYASTQVHGVMRVVKGDVQVKSGKNGALAKARIGGKVFPKDTIITGKDSRVKIVMIDKNEINISPESQLQIENYDFKADSDKKNVMLNVIYGKVRNKVNQKYDGEDSTFQVKTPSAVAGVRGTDFLTGFSPQTRRTEVITFEGRVDFGTLGANGRMTNVVPVSAGMMTTQSAGQPPQAPVQVPLTQLAQIDNSSNAETATGPGETNKSNERAPASDEKSKPEDKPSAEAAPASEPAKKEAAPGSGASTEPAPSKSPSNVSGTPSAPAGDANTTGPAGTTPTANLPNAAGPRGPASIAVPMPSVGVMFDPSKDLPSNNIVLPPALNLPQMPLAPINIGQPRPEDFLQNCQQCKDAVTSGPSRLIIRFNSQ